MARRYVLSKKDQVSGGRIAGAKSLAEGTGLFSMTPEEKHTASVAGGKTQGAIQGVKNRDMGQLAAVRLLPQTKAAQSKVGKKFGRAQGLKQGPLNDMDKVRTIAGCKKGAAVGGPIGRHVRHHVKRRILNLKCDLCVAAKESGNDIWWLSEYEPTDKRSWKKT